MKSESQSFSSSASISNSESPPGTNPLIHQSTDPSPAPPLHSSVRLRRKPRRNGKVARLSKVLRDKISQAILDGVPYSAIIENLGDDGKALTVNCLSTYKRGGHKDWLREQQLLHECRLRHELVFDLAREDSSINAYTAANKLAAALICEAVAEIGPESLRAAVRANPLNLLRMLNSLSRLTLGGIRCERHLAERATDGFTGEAHDGKGGVTPEFLEYMEKELKLL